MGADAALADLEPAALRASSGVIAVTTTSGAVMEAADVVLPIANFTEEEGTFTNLRGRVQRFLQARAAPGLARPSWFVLSELLAAAGDTTDYFVAAEVFEAMAESHPAFAELSYELLGLTGRTLAATSMAGDAA